MKFIKTYKGHGIYRHFPTFKGGAFMYGDETLPLYASIKEYESAIDSHIAQEKNMRPAHEKYWDTLPHEERIKWRRMCAEHALSASELAYAGRPINIL